MNVVCQGLGLLLLVTGALSATIATLGATCAAGDTCSVNGAVCDKASLTCQCQFGYVQSGAICSRPAMGLCGAGMCKSWDTMTCDANQCKCDASKGYVESSGNCVCDTAKFFTTKPGGGCIGNVGAACTAASDCQTGMVCTSSKCACDTTKNYATGNNNDASCTCNSVTFFTAKPGGGGCIGKVGAACSAASDCVTGMVCTSGTCACDTTKNYATGNNNDATCACANTYTESNGICCLADYTESNGACKLAAGKTCANDVDCARSMKCTSSACACDTAGNYVAGASGYKTCIGNVGAACTVDSHCQPNVGMKCTSGACACNTALNYAAGSNGAATCACASGYAPSNGLCCATGKSNMNGVCCATHSIESNGVCIGNVGAACSADSDCRPNVGMKCTSSKCACDATLHYAAGADDAPSCSCNSGAYFTSKTAGGGCTGNVGATCSANSDCRTDAGMVCTNSKCACDTTKSLLTGTIGATTCACASGFTYFSFYGKCAINVGGACTRDAGTFVPCVDNAMCDRATDTCKCDSASGYLATRTYCGACISGYTRVNGRCVANINGVCIPSTQSGVCGGGATCFAGNTTTVPQCLCASNQFDYTGSCSGAGGVVASLAGLLMALCMTSRLM